MKTMVRTLAIMVCMMLMFTVIAEVKLTPVLVHNNFAGDADFFYGTLYEYGNIVRISYWGNDAQIYSNLYKADGTPFSDMTFMNYVIDDGYLIGIVDNGSVNNRCVLATDGSIMIPAEYALIGVYGGEWVVSYVYTKATTEVFDAEANDGTKCIIDRVDIYHLPEGVLLAQLGRDDFAECQAVNHCLNIRSRSDDSVTTYDSTFTALGTVNSLSDDTYAPADYVVFYEGGLQGYTDKDGNVILEPTYNFIDIDFGLHGGLCKVINGDLWLAGLVEAETGREVLPAEFQAVYSQNATAPFGVQTYESHGYYCVEIDDKMAFAVEGGIITSQPKYPYDTVDINGASLLFEDIDGSKVIVAADGVETRVSGYSRVYAMNNCNGIFYKVTDADDNYGIIDWHGNVIMPCEYKEISESSDGQFILAYKEGENRTSVYQLRYPAKGGAPVENAPVEEAPAGDFGDAVSLLNSAATLLEIDAASNGATAAELLETAVGMLVGEDDAAGLLDSAITLLGIDPAANGATVISIIESALALIQ